ncbi:hypothetical protein YC2023_070702 [Brassica napus]
MNHGKCRAIGDSQALTLAESEENKLELQMKRDKRMHYPQRNLRELFEETELEDDDPFPEEITNLVGQTFMFGVYIQKDNASGGCYKVGKVWKDLRMLMTSEISESYSAPAQASEEPLLIENQSDDIVSTPSSKRKEVNKEAPELHSTSKKQCTKAIKSEKIRKDKSASS